MLTQGEQLQENQATDIFFRMTKVFQSKHTELKAMVYLTLRVSFVLTIGNGSYE